MALFCLNPSLVSQEELTACGITEHCYSRTAFVRYPPPWTVTAQRKHRNWLRSQATGTR